jgi:hypothetical protein
MFCLSKKFALILIFIIAVSCVLLVESVVAPVTMPVNPESAPEIVSIKINSNHYWRPPTYSTNPYTGVTTETVLGKYVPNGTIEITIKNRPFTPYTDKNGNNINIYYTIFAIGSSGPSFDWNYILEYEPIPWYSVYQSDDDYTVITAIYFAGLAPQPHLTPSYEGQTISFRVQAVEGHFIHNEETYARDVVFEGVGSEPTMFEITIPVTTGSNPKPTTTVIKPSTGVSTTSNPSSISQQKTLQFTVIIIVLVFVGIIAILLSIIVYQHKQRKTDPAITQTNPTTTPTT